MKFNYYDYDETYVMHCPTQEASDAFIDFVNSIKKADGEPGRYKKEVLQHSDRCYRFRWTTRDTVDWYINEECTILEFDDFDWGSETTLLTLEFSFDELMGWKGEDV